MVDFNSDEYKIQTALLEAVWITRWNKDRTALSAVITVMEAKTICKDIIKELDEAGYEIVKKKD